MSLDRDLFLTILAMDSYNRGYGPCREFRGHYEFRASSGDTVPGSSGGQFRGAVPGTLY